MKKKVVSLLLAATMVLSLAACGGSSSSGGGSDASGAASASGNASGAVEGSAAAAIADTTGDRQDSEPQYGGEATVYYPKFYNYYDPAMMDEYQFSFWYETLWVMDWGLNDSDTFPFDAGAIPAEYLQGQLAADDGWTWDQDAGTFTVQLRDDVYFQDGEPYNGRQFTANDVVWSYSRLLGLNGIEKVETEIDWSTIIYMVANVEATDDYTVVFTLADDYNNEVSIEALMNAKVNIAGPEWDDLTSDQQLDWNYAKGTGPYVITGYEDGNSMVLTKNENYYDYDERYPENKLPYIDQITLVYIADSSNVLAQAMSGDLDWFGENGKNVLSQAQLGQLSDADAGSLYKYLSSSPANIALKTTQAPFDDIRVRQAMQYAIDMETIDNSYFGNAEMTICGLWSPTLSTWSQVGTYSDELLAEYAYDPEQAQALLEEAGYADGFEFTIFLDPMGDADLYAVAADYLSQVGITMNIEVAAEMMESVQASQDGEDERQSNGYGGGFSSVGLATMMTGDGGMGNAYFIQDQDWYDQLHALEAATTVDEQTEIAQNLDAQWLERHYGVVLSGVQPSYDYMSYRIGGYDGEKIYYKQNMRTIWSRLWVNAE